MSNPFSKGDRVKFSDLGRRCHKHSDRHGVVTAKPQTSYKVMVLWDGNKVSVSIHVNFLAKADSVAFAEPAPPAADDA